MARELGVTRSTVGNAIRSLIDAGLVVEVAVAEPAVGRGRPGVGVSLNPAGAYAIGVDVGTRVVSGVLVDLRMNIAQRVSIPAGANFRDPEAALGKVIAVTAELARLAGIAQEKVAGVCVSVPGLVDRNGVVLNAPFLEWRDFQLRARLAERLPPDWKVEVRNDAVAMAAGECATLTAEEARSVLIVLLAEGIGSALVNDGRVMEGAHGQAGEIGHTILAVGDQRSSFELLAGAPAFSSFFGPEVPVEIGIGDLLERVAEPAVSDVLDTWSQSIAIGLVNAIYILDPSRVVLGGALASLYPHVEEKVLAGMRDHFIPGFEIPPILMTQYGRDGAAIGAAAMILDGIFALPDLH